LGVVAIKIIEVDLKWSGVTGLVFVIQAKVSGDEVLISIIVKVSEL